MNQYHIVAGELQQNLAVRDHGLHQPTLSLAQSVTAL